MTSKALVYKVARFNTERYGKTLQQMLEASLKKKKTALSRGIPGDEVGQIRLINYHGPHKGMRVGEFLDFTKGTQQPLAQIDTQAESLEISALAPPDKNEFLHSILYFGISGNCVILSQSTSLRSLHFEVYLNAFLTEAGLLKDSDFVALNDQISEEDEDRITQTKKIEFKAPVSITPQTVKALSADKKKTKSISYNLGGVAWEVLQHLLPKEIKLPKELRVEESLPKAALEVTVKLGWSRVTNDDSTSFLDQISTQLRHVDTELDYVIHTKSGKITRDEMKLRKTITVNTNSQGMIYKSEMWEAMHSWLYELVDNKTIIVE